MRSSLWAGSSFFTFNHHIILAKKKFSAGLDSIFEQREKEGSLVGSSNEHVISAPDDQNASGAKHSNSKKNFTTDLESLLQEALDETVYEHVEQLKNTADPTKERTKAHSRMKQALSGLDALIRQTSEDDVKVEFKRSSGQSRRVTFTIDPQKLTKLKNIARSKKAYIKDIIGELVAEYIKSEQDRLKYSPKK